MIIMDSMGTMTMLMPTASAAVNATVSMPGMSGMTATPSTPSMPGMEGMDMSCKISVCQHESLQCDEL